MIYYDFKIEKHLLILFLIFRTFLEHLKLFIKIFLRMILKC